VLHRVHDIDSDKAVNEQRWAALQEESRRVSALQIPLSDLPADMRALLDNTVGAARPDGHIDHVLCLSAERSIAIGHAGLSRKAIFDATRSVIEERLAALSNRTEPDEGRTARAPEPAPAGRRSPAPGKPSIAV